MSYVAPHADFRAAILAAAESGDLKEALDRWRLHNLAVVFVRDNKWTARELYTFTAGIGYDLIEFDLLGGTGDGETLKAWRDAGLEID